MADVGEVIRVKFIAKDAQTAVKIYLSPEATFDPSRYDRERSGTFEYAEKIAVAGTHVLKLSAGANYLLGHGNYQLILMKDKI